MNMNELITELKALCKEEREPEVLLDGYPIISVDYDAGQNVVILSSLVDLDDGDSEA